MWLKKLAGSIKQVKNFSRQRLLSIFLSVIFIISLVITFGQQASAAVIVSTSSNSEATKFSQQRKTWSDGARHWASFNANSRIEFWYSSDGSSWTENTSARISVDTHDFSIEADSSNAFIVTRETAATVAVRNATGYPAVNFAWDTTPTSVYSSAGGVSTVHINRDTNNKVLVSLAELENNYFLVASRSDNANNSPEGFTQIGGDIISNLVGIDYPMSTINPLASGEALSVHSYGASFRSKKYNGSAWDSGHTHIGATTGNNSDNFSTLSNTTNDEVYMSYIDSGNKTKFQRYVDKKGGNGVKIDDAGDPGAFAADGRNLVRSSTGSLYAAINDGGSCEIWKSTDNGSNWAEVDENDNPVCSAATSKGISIAIDSSDNIHMVYCPTNSTVSYIQLSSADQFGSTEAVGTASLTLDSPAIAVDSSNVPHVAFFKPGGSSQPVSYDNRVGGSFGTDVVVENVGTSTADYIDIVINEDNIPEISYINETDSDLTAAVGNQNDASSFTVHDVDVSVPAGSSQGTSIGVDASGNTWIVYQDTVISSSYATLVKHNDADAWTTWQSPSSASNTGSEPSMAISGDVVYVMYQDATTNDIFMETYLTTWSGSITVATGTFQDANVRWAFNSNYKHGPLDFLYSDGTDVYYSNTGFWNEPVTLDSNSGNAYTSLSINTANNDLYAFWIRSNTIYYKKCVSPYASANCDTNPTTFYTGTNPTTWLTTYYQVGGSKIGAIWTWSDGSPPPYEIQWDAISFQSPPSAPSMVSPAQPLTGATGIPYTGYVFKARAADAQGEYLRYEFIVYDSSNCTGTVMETATQGGGAQGTWTNQDQQSGTAYTGSATESSSTMAFHGYGGTNLTANHTYSWKARAIDPGGSNTYGSFSSCQSFLSSQAPAAPTLYEPGSGATVITKLPRFKVRTTDADNDYLRYHIKVYTNQTECNNDTGTALVRNIDQVSDQTVWFFQDQQTSTAYTGSSTIDGSTMALHQYQVPALADNTVHWWKARAKDAGGSDTWGSWATCQAFTTSTGETQLRGGVDIRGGTNIR